MFSRFGLLHSMSLCHCHVQYNRLISFYSASFFRLFLQSPILHSLFSGGPNGSPQSQLQSAGVAPVDCQQMGSGPGACPQPPLVTTMGSMASAPLGITSTSQQQQQQSHGELKFLASVPSHAHPPLRPVPSDPLAAHRVYASDGAYAAQLARGQQPPSPAQSQTGAQALQMQFQQISLVRFDVLEVLLGLRLRRVPYVCTNCGSPSCSLFDDWRASASDECLSSAHLPLQLHSAASANYCLSGLQYSSAQTQPSAFSLSLAS